MSLSAPKSGAGTRSYVRRKRTGNRSIGPCGLLYNTTMTEQVSAPVPRELSIADVALECHFSESTLRMWERRYQFPSPQRTSTGCRRYSERDVQQIREVLRLRQQGLSLPAAVARVQHGTRDGRRPSLSAQLRTQGAHVPIAMSKDTFELLAAAFADECASTGVADVVLLGLRRDVLEGVETSWWTGLAQVSRLAVAFGDSPLAASRQADGTRSRWRHAIPSPVTAS